MPEGDTQHPGNTSHDFGSFDEIAKSARETTIIRHNRFDGPRLGKTPGPGVQHPIDLDDWSSNFEIYENLGVGMSIKTFCSSYCKFHDNVFVRSYPLRLLQPFDGKLEIRDNHFVEDLTPAEAAARFLPGVHFGLAGNFSTWLRDPDRVVIKTAGGLAYRGSPFTLEPVFDGSPPEIRYNLDGSAPKAQSLLYLGPIRLTSPGTILGQTLPRRTA
jgi:hypothetical protein